MSGLNSSEDSQNLFSANQVTRDYESLEPVQERIKLEGDEYESKRRNKDLATSASYEIYRSLDSLPLEQMLSMQNSIQDSLMSGSLLGYPVVNVRVKILDGRWSNIRSKNPLIFQMCANQLLKSLIDQSSP